MADCKFALPFAGKRERFYCSSGDKEFPIFEYNEDGELVDTGRKENVYDKIQSYKDEVLLENIIKRCGLTGETLEAPKEAFGDSTVLPQSLLELKQNGQKVQSFVDSLSDDDLKSLNDKGFDAFLLDKLQAMKAKEQDNKGVNDNE